MTLDPSLDGDALERAIERVRAGDLDAAAALMQAWRSELCSYVERRAGRALLDLESKEDIVQSACREVLGAIDGTPIEDGAQGFKAWLFGATLHKIIDRQRFWKAAKRDQRRRVDAHWTSASLDALRATITAPDQAAERSELRERFRLVLDQLPEHYEEVLRLAHMEGLSRAEIGRRTGRSEVAVRTLLARAMARLTRLVDEQLSDN